MKMAIAALLLSSLPACATTATDEAPSGGCTSNGSAASSAERGHSALDAEALRLSGARRLRWIRPGDMVTMDYSPQRLNIHLDGAGRIERFTCG